MEKVYIDTTFPDGVINIPELPMKPYGYQFECFKECVSRNTLLVLPTGMGKTLISILTLIEFKKFNERKDGCEKRVALFLVDRVPLVVQQSHAIEEIGKSYKLKALQCYGEINDENKRENILKKDYDVLVSTAQSVVNLIEKKELRIEDFYLIVFDEVHHAMDDHPFSKIMDFYEMVVFNLRPRILGLTASICSEAKVKLNLEKIKAIEKRMNSQVFCPSFLVNNVINDDENEDNYDDNNNNNNNNVKHEISTFKTYDQENIFFTEISTYFSKLVKQFLDICQGYSDLDLDDINNQNRYLYGLRKLETHIKQTFPKEEQNHKVFELIMKVYETLENMQVVGVHKSLVNLFEIIKETSLMERIQEQMKTVLFFNDLNDAHLRRNSSRYDKFLEIFKSFLNDYSQMVINTLDKDENGLSKFRSIVFVETRYCSEQLLELVKQDKVLCEFNPKLFVGHSGDGGMDASEQQEILSEFKSGETKLLIATNVLEEGLDIKYCNLVISYDGIQSLKSLIQRRGRARSSNHSKFIILTNESDRVQTESLLNRENIMILSISQLMKERLREREERVLQLNWKLFSPKVDSQNSSGQFFYISFYHIDNIFFKEYASHLIYGMEDYKLLNIERVVTPGVEEPFLKFSYVVSIEYLGDNVSKSVEDMILEVLDVFRKDYRWWAKVPTHLTNIHEHESRSFKTLGSGLWKFEHIIHHMAFGNFYEPTVFTHSIGNILPINIANSATLRLCKKEFQIHIGLYQYFMYFDDLHPYCAYRFHTSDQNTCFQFYLFLIRPGKITRRPKKDQQSTIRSTPPPELEKFYGNSFAYKFSILNPKQGDINDLKFYLKKYGFELFHCNIKEVYSEPPPLSLDGILDKEILYSFKCLETSKSFGRPIYQQNFVDKITELLKEGDNGYNTAKFILREALEKKTLFYDLLDIFKDILEKMKINSSKEVINWTTDKKWAEVKMVVVTPSRIIFKPTAITQTNRVIRNFSADRFILFHFQDEKLQKVSYLGEDVRKYVEKFITETGISVAGETFRYLGGSQSLMKNVGAWFYNEEDAGPYTIERIRKWMGSIPAFPRKFLRSMGILFSSTTPTILISKSQFIEESENNTRPEFTEGCGTIGIDLMQEIIKKFNYPAKTCSLQIRIGGYKGVLSIDPNPNNNRRNAIFLRNSMKKFPTDSIEAHRTLEIISISSAKTCKLSRPLITLLSGIGAPDFFFLDLFHDTLTKMTLPLVNTEIALKQLSSYFPGITEYELVNDNYLKRIQIILYKMNLEKLQQRYNMELVHSRNLLGIADETKELNLNEVFIQITEKTNDNQDNDDDDGSGNEHYQRRVITGLVGVTRNPANHPGDIRFLMAVNNPTLQKYYTDVIVFSQQGDKPSFQESSGGDLDGDRYFVFYDQDLLSTCQQHQPSCFQDLPTPKEVEQIDICKSQVLGKQFCENLQKGFIGDLSNALLAVSDRLGVKHNYSIELARQCFIEVDVFKHGINGRVPPPVSDFLKQNGYPHFMNHGGESKVYYQSDKVLGTMYDQCSQLNWIGDQLPDIQLQKELLVDGHEEYLEQALEDYNLYKSEVKSLLHRCSAKSEEELTIGFFENPVVNHSFTAETKKVITAKFEEIRKASSELFLHEFNEQQGLEETLIKHYKEIEKKISAWYKIAYSDKDEKRTLSFYWNVKKYQKKQENERFQQLNFKYFLTRSIIDYFKQKMADPLFKDLYQQRLAIVKEIHDHLKKKDSIFSLYNLELQLCGTTPLLLFDKDSSLHLYLAIEKDENLKKMGQNDIISQLSFALSTLIKNPRITENMSSIVGRFKKLDISITINNSEIKKTLLNKKYIREYPFLFPFLLIILSWGRASYLVTYNSKISLMEKEHNRKKRKDGAQGINYLSSAQLIDLTINYYIDNRLIKELNIFDINNNNNVNFTSWESQQKDIDRSLESPYLAINSPTFDLEESLGRKLLDFFNIYNKFLLDFIWSGPKNNPKSPSDGDRNSLSKLLKLFRITSSLEDRNSLIFYQETFLVAYHSLSHSKDFSKFLENCTSSQQSQIPIKIDKKAFMEKYYPEIVHKLGNLMHVKYTLKSSSSQKPKSIFLKGSKRSISEAANIVRTILSK